MQFDDEYPAGELFISSASLTITGFVIYKKKFVVQTSIIALSVLLSP